MYNLIIKNKKISLYFFDQVIVSATNFILTILLVRFLGVTTFGIYSFFWIFLLLINSIQIAYIISPMLTNSAKKNDRGLKVFFGCVFINQLLFSIIIIFFLTIFFLYFFDFFFDFEISSISLSFCVLIFFSQFHTFLRKLYICKNYIKKLIIYDLLYSIALFGLIFYFYFTKELNIENIFWILSLSNLLVIFLYFVSKNYIKFDLRIFFNYQKENWKISKWLLLTALTQWFSGNLWLINTGLILGPYYLGIIRSCQSVISIGNLIFQSIENIYSINISKKLNDNGPSVLKNYINQITYKGFIIVCLLSILISLNSERLLFFIFGPNASSEYYILIYLSFLLPLMFLQYFPQHALRAFSKTFPIFLAYFISSIFTIISSKIIINKFEIYGFLFGMYSSLIIILFVIYYYYFRYIKNLEDA